MRCFIAVDIDDAVRTELGKLQQRISCEAAPKKGLIYPSGLVQSAPATSKAIHNNRLRSYNRTTLSVGGIKWVRPEQMHLTLKFLGEIPDRQSVQVCKIVAQAAEQYEKFELSVQGVGYFGRAARVLWAGIGGNVKKLELLQQEIEQQLEKAGFPRDIRKFSAHLTLCRVKNPAAAAKLARISQNYHDFDAGTFSVKSVSVYQSQLTSAGPLYTLLGGCALSC